MSRVRTEPTAEASPVVICEAVSREFDRGSRSRLPWRRRDGPTVTAIRNVSLAVRRGEMVGVAGPSGSGKSTLLHLLAALDVPTTGRVVLAATDTASVSERGRTRLRLDHVGVIFQRFHLLPALSARANVALPLIERGVGKRTRRERATELLERVGLGDRAGHRPGELSGGEQQRVAVARALVTDPDLLVADEPTGELDTETGAGVLSLFEDLARERAVVVASHDDRALAAADRTVALVDGRVVEDRS